MLSAAFQTHEDTQVDRRPDWISLATINALFVACQYSQTSEILGLHAMYVIVIVGIIEHEFNRSPSRVIDFASRGHVGLDVFLNGRRIKEREATS
jgi:hypothetical protein